MAYHIPAIGQRVQWPATTPATQLRFTADSVALLHLATEGHTSTGWKSWNSDAVTLGICNQLDYLAVLAAQIGHLPALAAPACIFEAGDAAAVQQWLRKPENPFATIALVLLQAGAESGQAAVVAVRVVEDVAELLAALRGQMHDQYVEFTWDEAAALQQAGRALVQENDALTLLLNSYPPLQVPRRL